MELLFRGIARAGGIEQSSVDAIGEQREQPVHAAYPRLSHRYYKLKAKWLGMDKLAHWDRNAPLPEKPDGRGAS